MVHIFGTLIDWLNGAPHEPPSAESGCDRSGEPPNKSDIEKWEHEKLLKYQELIEEKEDKENEASSGASGN